jgi:hypothetical protein
MPLVGFKPTVPACERAKTVHALDRSATVTGSWSIGLSYIAFLTKCCQKITRFYTVTDGSVIWMLHEVVEEYGCNPWLLQIT